LQYDQTENSEKRIKKKFFCAFYFLHAQQGLQKNQSGNHKKKFMREVKRAREACLKN